MRFGWWMGAVVVLAFGFGGHAGAKTANLTVTPDGTSGSCGGGVTTCFDVQTEEERNITHIFINVSFCEQVDPPFSVTVDGVPIEHLHFRGGPCNHGDDEIGRLAWFPLTGNQDHALVCVTAENVGSFTVGAKSQDECVQSSSPTNCCDPPSDPPASYDM